MSEPPVPALLAVEDLVKEFRRPGTARTIRAIDGVSLQVRSAECLALVGESGCGKTTLARCVLGLTPVTSGRVLYDGVDLATVRRAARRRARRRVQIVFQNPYAALNPRMTVARLVGEAADAGPGPRGKDAVVALLEAVGLAPAQLTRYPHELSGGQCQRVALARALAVRPEVIVLDEPTSALDVSVQAQILRLLADTRAAYRVAYLLISHDLAVVRHLADRVAVMKAGQILETGPAHTVLDTPIHSYTRLLAGSVPGRGRDALLADPTDPAPLTSSRESSP